MRVSHTPPLPYADRPALHLVPGEPTTERSLLELLPDVRPLPPRLSPRRLPRRMRATHWIKRNGTAAASGIATCVVAAHVITTALTGGIQ